MSRRGESIYHRKDGLWEARYDKGYDVAGKKKYGSVYAHSYREAKKKRQEIVSRMTLCPQSVSAGTRRLEDLIEEWLYINQGRIKPSTYQKYSAAFHNHIQPAVGGVPITGLSPVMFKRFADSKHLEGLSETTVNGYLTFIRTCLKYGNRQYGIPLIDVVYLKQPRKEMRVLTPEEQNTLVRYLLEDTDVYKLGILLALYTGVRIGELCALTWGDVFDGKLRITKTMQRLSKGKGKGTELIIGEPKTNTSSRTIPVPSFLVPHLERFRQADELHLLSVKGKRTTEPRTMQYQFKKCIKAVGLPNANFHCLRHTFATRCVEAGCEVKSLSEILGHSGVNITLCRYVHSSFELKARNIEKLSLFV